MAGKGEQVIIVKKKGGGHGGGHHGGAWKVAYADFVTAMMAFFLVMWLMGSDEEVKSIVTHYFNNPSTPWRKELSSSEIIPMGDRTGAGDSVLKGMDGELPEDLVQSPNLAVAQQAQKSLEERQEAENFQGKIPAELDVDMELIQYSIPENELFDPASEKLTVAGQKRLHRIGNVIRRYKGYVTIRSYAHNNSEKYDESVAKAVVISRHIVKKHWIDEERIHPTVGKPSKDRQPSREGLFGDHRVDILLTKSKLHD